jgi:ferredoxin
MPRIEFAGQVIECGSGENLRRVLRKTGLPLYNGISAAIHCRGMGTCGTCAVEIVGEVTDKTAVEKWRLGFPPHSEDRAKGLAGDLRLACQCEVQGDLVLTKHGGMWGSRIGSNEGRGE